MIPNLDMDTWLAQGSTLLAERDAAQWRLADWIASGRRMFGNPAGIVPVAVHLNLTAHKLRAMAKVSIAFPPDRRDMRLSFTFTPTWLACPRTSAAP